MKQATDKFTRDVFDTPRVGRPPSPNAKSSAQRAKEYRARVRAKKLDSSFDVT